VEALITVLPLSAYETDPNESALRIAAVRGNVAVARILLNAGAEVNWSSPEYMGTALHLAAEYGHLDMVRLLIDSGATLDSPAENNFTPLHYAAQEGHQTIVSALISSGANVNAMAIDNYTPLHSAAGEGHSEVIQELLANAANVNAQLQNTLSTPLHLSALTLDPASTQSLIAGGADVNLKRSDGYAPIHIALIKRFELVISGAKTTSSFSFTEEGVSISSATAISFHDGLPLIQLLLANGAEPNLAGPQGNTPLHIAASNGDVASVKLLLESGASSNLTNADGKIPLEIAIEQSGNVFKQLLAKADYPGVIELLAQV
jgi:ankyrin repeat protein